MTSTAPGVLPAVSVKVAMPVALVVVVAGETLVPVPEVRLRLTEAFTIRTFELAFSTVTVNFVTFPVQRVRVPGRIVAASGDAPGGAITGDTLTSITAAA